MAVCCLLFFFNKSLWFYLVVIYRQTSAILISLLGFLFLAFISASLLPSLVFSSWFCRSFDQTYRNWVCLLFWIQALRLYKVVPFYTYWWTSTILLREYDSMFQIALFFILVEDLFCRWCGQHLSPLRLVRGRCQKLLKKNYRLSSCISCWGSTEIGYGSLLEFEINWRYTAKQITASV